MRHGATPAPLQWRPCSIGLWYLSALPYRRLSAFYLVYFAALGLFSPYWGAYLESRGLAHWQIAVIMSLWFGTRAIAPMPWAWLSERYGRNEHWLRAGAALTLMSFGLFLLPLGYGGILVVMAVFAAAYNAIMPQFEAMTLAHLGPRRSLYGRIRVWGSVGFALTVTGAGVLIDQLGYAVLPWVLLPLFLVLFAVAWINHDPEGMSDTARVPLAAVWQRSRDPSVVRLLMLALLMQVAHGPYYVYFAIYLEHQGFGASWVGAYWAVGLALEIGIFLIMPQILARFDARWLLAACALAGALRWAVVAWLPTQIPLMLLAQAAHALTFGVFHATTMQILSGHFPGRLGGHGQGLLYGISSGFGGVIGALAAGAAWRYLGPSAAFLMAMVVSLLAIALCPWIRPAADPHPASH